MSAKLFITKSKAEAFVRRKEVEGYAVYGPVHVREWSGKTLYGPGDWVVSYGKPRRDPKRGRAQRDPSPRVRKTKIPRAKQRWISEKIRLLVHEGKPQRQAIAIAYRMAGVPPRPQDVRARKGKTKKRTTRRRSR